MAPLPAALGAPTPTAPKGGAAGSAPPAEAAPFAQLLGLTDGPVTAAAAGAAVAPPAPGLQEFAAEAGEALADTLDPAAEDVLTAASTPLQAPTDAPWPPTGLGGLFAASAATGVPASPDAGPVGSAARTRAASSGLVGAALAGPQRSLNAAGLPGTAPHPVLAGAASTGAAAADAAASSSAALAAASLAGGSPAAAGTAPPAALPAASLAEAAAVAAAVAADAVEAESLAATAKVPLDVEGAEPAPSAFTLPQMPTAPTVRDAAPLLAAPVPTPDVRAGDFGDRFGAQVQWMAGQNIGHARIQVTPHDLGPVEVLLHMDGDRISADFISAHAETRQALEQGLPRLRDLLGEHGFQLAHAGVGSDGPAARDDDGRAAAAGGPAGADGMAESGAGTHEPAPMRTLRGLVDAYA